MIEKYQKAFYFTVSKMIKILKKLFYKSEGNNILKPIEIARNEYFSRLESLNKILKKLNSDEIKQFEKMGLITINRSNIPSERDILLDSFRFASQGISDNLYIYVCDLIDYGQRNYSRRYGKAVVRDLEQSPFIKKPYNVSKYIGLFTGKQQFVYLSNEESFKHFNSIIQLPYDYQIRESEGLYIYGTWPLQLEGYYLEGFKEQFDALQYYYFSRLLGSSFNEVDNEISDEINLKKICLIRK